MNANNIEDKVDLVVPWKKHGGDLNNDEVFSKRLPLVKRLPTKVRGHIVAVLGEFVGTFLFLFIAFAATLNANTTNDQIVSKNLYISLGFGFSLAVNAWTFFRVSGGLFNPAVTWGMYLVGGITWVRAILLFITQLVAAIVAAAMARALFPAVLDVQTSLAAGTTITQGFFIEMFLTLQLVLTIFLLAAEKNRATFIAPVGIGLALFLAELAGVRYTGGSLNPARTLGPAVVNSVYYSYHWIYWIGPLLGATLAAVIYKLIKMLEYETANPEVADVDGQGSTADDHDGREKRPASKGRAGRAMTPTGPASEDQYSRRLSQSAHREIRSHGHQEQFRNDYQVASELENGRAGHAGPSRDRV